MWQVQDSNEEVLTMVNDDYVIDEIRTDFLLLDKESGEIQHYSVDDEGNEKDYRWENVERNRITKDCIKLIRDIITSNSGLQQIESDDEAPKSVLLNEAIRYMDSQGA